MTNKELITEARKVERRVRSTLDTTVADLVRDLADALEAAAPNVHYEYGFGWPNGRKELARSRNAAITEASCRPHGCQVYKRVQKRNGHWPAGPWLPVEGERKP